MFRARGGRASKWLMIAVLATLAAGASAQLGRPSDLDVTAIPIVQRFVSIAADFWRESPAQLAADNGCASYTVEVGPTVIATSEGEAAQPGCWQRWSPGVWNQLLEERGNAEDLRTDCLLTVHEYGHSTGRGHVDDPANVMYGQKTSLSAVPGCTAAFPLPGEHSRKRSARAVRAPAQRSGTSARGR
jgi:hypothetical protein